MVAAVDIDGMVVAADIDEMVVAADTDEVAGVAMYAVFASCADWMNYLKVKVSENNIDEMQ